MHFVCVSDSVSSARIQPVHTPHHPSSPKVSTTSPWPAPPSVFSVFLLSFFPHYFCLITHIAHVTSPPFSQRGPSFPFFVFCFFFTCATLGAVNSCTQTDGIASGCRDHSAAMTGTPGVLSKTWISHFENCSCSASRSGPGCSHSESCSVCFSTQQLHLSFYTSRFFSTKWTNQCFMFTWGLQNVL